jgi:hypothetical protein
MHNNALFNTNFTYTVLYGVVFSLLLMASSSLIIISQSLLLGLTLICLLIPVLFFSVKRHADILVIAGVSSVTFLALYFPVLGFILGSINQVPLFELKVAVGIRSVVYSFLLIVFVALVSIDSTQKKLAQVGLSLIVVFILIFSFISSSSSFVPKVTYLINTFVPLFFTYIGILLLSNSARGYIEQTFVLKALTVFVTLSFVYFVALELFYDIVRPDLISAMRSKDGLPVTYGEYPGSWGSMIAEVRFNRFVGSFPDPILFGYFMAMLAIFTFSKKAYALSFVFLLMVFLSGAKVALLLFVNTLFLVAVLKHFNGLRFVTIIGLVGFQIVFATLFQSSATIHLEGLQGSINSILNGGLKELFFGYGIGSGGNLARFSEGGSSHGWLESGSESGVGILLYQLGLFGFLFYVYIIYLVDRRLNRNYKVYKDSSYIYALAIIVSVFINSFMQENCVNASVLSMMLFTVILILFVRKGAKGLYAIS